MVLWKLDVERLLTMENAMRARLALTSVIILCWTGFLVPSTTGAVQSTDSETLQKIQLKTGRVRFGFVLKSTPDLLEILDIQSNSDVQLKRSEIQTMSSEHAEVDAVKRMGLPVVLSWKIKHSASKRVRTGKVAKLEGGLVYVTLGKGSGLAAGDLLRVYRGEAEIRDPDTQKVLGHERKLVGQLIITDVQDRFLKRDCRVKLTSISRSAIKSNPVSGGSVAVLPFTTISGGDSAAGALTAERLTSELAKREISVVDRALLVECLTNSRFNSRRCLIKTRLKNLEGWPGHLQSSQALSRSEIK